MSQLNDLLVIAFHRFFCWLAQNSHPDDLLEIIDYSSMLFLLIFSPPAQAAEVKFDLEKVADNPVLLLGVVVFLKSTSISFGLRVSSNIPGFSSSSLIFIIINIEHLCQWQIATDHVPQLSDIFQRFLLADSARAFWQHRYAERWHQDRSGRVITGLCFSKDFENWPD